MKKSTRVLILFLSSFSLFSKSAWALPEFDATSFAGVNDAMIQSVIKTVAIGADFRAFRPAAALGAVIGLDVGIDGVLVKTPAEFRSAMQQTGGGDPGDYVGVPRLNIHKGLPGGVDLGFSYFGYSGYSLLGFDIQYAPLRGGAAKPALAIRASYNKNDLFWVKTTTWKFDLLVSKSFVIFEPYLGFGLQAFSGDVELSSGQSLDPGVSGSFSGEPAHFFVGTPLKLGIFHITAEFDRSFAGVTTYGAKVSLNI